MIKQLKKRVVFAAMISVTLVLVLIIGAINMLNYQSIIRDLDDVLYSIHENDGQIPEEKDNENTQPFQPIEGLPVSPEQPYRDRYLTMIYYEDDILTNFNDSERISIARDIGTKIQQKFKHQNRDEEKNDEKKSDEGFLIDLTGFYRYYVGEVEDENGVAYTRITFIDSTITMQNYYTFFALSIAVSVVSLLIIFIMMMIFAANIIAPIAESYEKQKRFITDAGHDIKTPITIIDADREILEMDIGENEWLDDIRRQTKRLTKLTNDLIYLSRMEEGTDLKELSSFSISTVCLEEADSFSAVAKTKNLEIVTDIEDKIDINGSEEDVRKLLAILLDNAVKYAKADSEIGIKLRKHGKMASFTVSNTAENMTQSQTKKMFDRFYRADAARGSEGGFGIGLAMAQAIAVSHNGKISAELSENQILSITVSFPVQFGSFKLITNFVDKNASNVNNGLQKTAASQNIIPEDVEDDANDHSDTDIVEGDFSAPEGEGVEALEEFAGCEETDSNEDTI